jgi:hypothetical protein
MFEPLQATRGQIVVDFVVDHIIAIDSDACVVELMLWKLFFECSVCSRGWGIRCVIISPNNIHFDISVGLEFASMNN